MVQRIDRSLGKAARFLNSGQDKDGAWRSKTYGALRDGASLTPLALNALFFLPQGGPGTKRAFDQGVQWLVAQVDKKGRLTSPIGGFTYPTMSAAIACRVLGLYAQTPESVRAHRAWLAYLLNRRLSSQNGWSQEDGDFGAWGFCPVLPRKPKPGEIRPPFCESNLVATIFGIAAIRGAKPSVPSRVNDEILAFVKRCQNFSDDPNQTEPEFDDGGFVFFLNDDVQNRAGAAGRDKSGKTRYRSYGSVTADGLRALIRLGLPINHPRVVAARKWLERHFTVTTNPGAFVEDRRIIQDAAYYYYMWAVTHAFLALNLREIEAPQGRIEWITPLCDELLRKQRPDGSWKNPQGDAKEDDPIIATSFATSALAVARQMLSGEAKELR